MSAGTRPDRQITGEGPVALSAALAELRTVACGDVIVFDLEYTSWPGSLEREWSGSNEHREVIQIGAVRITGYPDFAERDAFACLVRPNINPALSEHVQVLTGIRQADIDAYGLNYADAQARFFNFSADTVAFLSNGNDAAVLAENAALNGLPDPRACHRFLNVRPLLGAALGRLNRSFSSADLNALTGAPAAGRAHDGLADARAVAAALAWAVRRGN